MAGSPADRRALLEETAQQVRACTLCRLHVGRNQAVPGEGPPDADVLVIGEAPGRGEDASGRPFVGAAGRILDKALAVAGLPRDSVFITNVVKCRPPSNRRPLSDELKACRSYLTTQMAAVRPRVIVTLGSTALKALLEGSIDLKGARGETLAYNKIPLIATYHPAAILYNRRLEAALQQDVRKAARLAHQKRSRIRSGPPRRGKPTQPAASSGAVVAASDGRIVLLKRADEAIWCLPKGTVERGETLEQTAIREVREETGLRVKLLYPVQDVRYSFYWPPADANVDKTVTYFLAKQTGGRLTPEIGFDEARWVTRDEALRLLHWKNDKDVVERAFAAMRSVRS